MLTCCAFVLDMQMYAEQSDKNAKAFNCVQRAHQNLLENLPVFFSLLLTASYVLCFYMGISVTSRPDVVCFR